MIEKGLVVKKTLVILIVICCSTVTYATSVSVMMTAPKFAAARSVETMTADVSEILPTVYGEYPRVLGKSEASYTTNALSASFQRQGSNSEVANMDNEGVGDTPNSDPTSPPQIPEPNTLLMVGVGLAGLGIALRTRR